MKKNILILIIVLLHQFSFSQSRWSLGLSYQPGSSGLENLENYTYPDTSEVYVGNNYSQSLSEIIEFRVNKRIHLRSGFDFNIMGFKWQLKREFYTNDMIEFIDSVFPQNAGWQKSLYEDKYYFIGIPFTFLCDVRNSGKFNISVDAGFLVKYLFGCQRNSKHQYLDRNTESTENTLSSNRFHYNLQLGASLRYGLSDKLRIILEPNFIYDLTKLENPDLSITGLFNGNFYQFGINIGILYNLK